MKKQIKLADLSKEIKLDIIGTLFLYDSCHIEHENGKTIVATSYCLKSKYAEDSWISQEFTREELGITFEGNDEWCKRCSEYGWSKAEKDEDRQAILKKVQSEFDEIAQKEIERIEKEAR
jgi:hypothetical protein